MKNPYQATVRVLIYGAVQDVGYRRWLKRAALARGLDGWVRNRSDGTVEAVLAGHSDRVALMLLRCHDGPRLAVVESILVDSYGGAVTPGFRSRRKQLIPVNKNKIVSNYLRGLARNLRQRWKGYVRRKSKLEIYRRWREQNPTESFKRFYVARVRRHLDGKGGSHNTLGPNPRKRGDAILRQLIELGVRPSDVVVDYGCGTLREGVYLIRYLEVGNYIGLDIDKSILEAGQRLAGKKLMAEKKPSLWVIESESLSRAAAANPVWVVSSNVLMHVPPDDVDEYINNLAYLIKERGRVILDGVLTDRTIQYSPIYWHHGRRALARGLARGGLIAVPTTIRNLGGGAVRVQMIVSAKSLPRVAGLDKNLAE